MSKLGFTEKQVGRMTITKFYRILKCYKESNDPKQENKQEENEQIISF